MPAGVRHFPDPNIEHGHFRVLPFTEGGFIVVDTRKMKTDPTRAIVKRFKQLQNAADAAKKWHEEGR